MHNKIKTASDFWVGEKGSTRSRTLGAAEISAFSGITCDYTFLHTSEHEAAKTFYGGRIAHGLLGCSIALGQLSMDAPHTIGRTVENSVLCGFDIQYRHFIKMDDSVRTDWEILSVDADPDVPDCGKVGVGFSMVSQDEKRVYTGRFDLRVPQTLLNLGGLNPVSGYRSALWQPQVQDHNPDHVFSIADFAEGLGGVTTGRTLTETDVINFVNLTGDHSPLYVDQLYAEKSAFGRRTVPPMLVFDLALGYWARDSWITHAKCDDSAQDIGHLGDNSRFFEPVYVGDTILCVYRINSARRSRSQADRTVLDYGFQIVNQHQRVVQEGHVFVVKGKMP